MKHELLKNIKAILIEEFLPAIPNLVVDLGRLNDSLIVVDRELAGREKVFDREEFMTGLIVWETMCEMINRAQTIHLGAGETAVRLYGLQTDIGLCEMRERAIELGVKLERACDLFNRENGGDDSPLNEIVFDLELVPDVLDVLIDDLHHYDGDVSKITDQRMTEVLTQSVKELS